MSLGKIGVTVSARTNSKRLPAKAFLPIDGKPSCLFLLDRLRESLNYPLYVATTTHHTDDMLANLLNRNNYVVFRGDEENVFNRLLSLAKHFSLDSIVRITADCPMLDGLLVNQLIEESKNLTGWDLITTKGSGLPGLDIEIISRHLMYELEAKLNSYDKEHVTSFIYRNASYFQIAQIGKRGTNSTNHPLLLDTLDDFFKINEFVEEYGPSYTFGKQ